MTATAAETLRDQFLLDPDVVFLNHGSYGACPKPVFDRYQWWQRELERQPVDFLGRRSDDLLDAARAEVAAYVGADADDLVFVTNATSGLNVIARSLPLGPGDEILTTDHEYGALNLTWEHVCAKTGARYVHHPIPLPVTTAEELVASFWSRVTPRTKAIFLSHITSVTALILPVAEICRRAREAGILTIVDGAHVPGQIPLDLGALGADIYAGNCHKWLCAPKGSAFLYVRPEHQSAVEALVVSWGWARRPGFVGRNQWQGTRDIAAFLATPDAIAFQAEHDWPAVRARCHDLATDVRDRICARFALPPVQPAGLEWYAQMVVAPLPVPPGDEAVALQRRLYDRHRIEVPLTRHDDQAMVRISVQGYNTAEELDLLVEALGEELPGRTEAH